MRVFVVGSVNIDSLYRVHALPGPGETVSALSEHENPGGKGANQAVAAAAAGASVTLVGAVGADGAEILGYLRGRGVDVETVGVRMDASTGRAIVFVDDASENSIVVLAAANATVGVDDVESGMSGIAADDVVVLQGEISADANLAAAAVARRAGARVIWNAAPVPASAAEFPAVDLLVVNEHELQGISVLIGAPDDDDVGRVAKHVSDTLGADVVCTQGAEPSIWVTAQGQGFVPAHPTVVNDTTAAGDTVVGYLAAFADRPLHEALGIASAAAAITVSRPGASSSIPRLDELALEEI